MTVEFKLPDLGVADSGHVVDVLVREGDEVTANQNVLRVDTGLAVTSVPCPHRGIVKRVYVRQGDTLSAGTVVLVLDEPAAELSGDPHWPLAQRRGVWLGNDVEVSPPAEAIEASGRREEVGPEPSVAEERSTAEPVVETPSAESSKTLRLLPAASSLLPKLAGETVEDEVVSDARMAAEQDVPEEDHDDSDTRLHLAAVPANVPADVSEDEGTTTGDEVEPTAEVLPEAESQPSPPPAERETPTPYVEPAEHDAWGPIRRAPLSPRREAIALHMARSATTIPHVTNFDDADITELERIRCGSMADYAGDVKLTMLSFLLKAVAMALKRYPEVNASVDWEEREIVYKDYVHLGIAVDTEEGLVVPVLRDAEGLSIPEIARAVAQLAEGARDGRGEGGDLRGATFTVSNLGAVGGSFGTPMIHDPEVALLLAGRARKMPVVVEDNIEVRRVMPLSLSYDQRLIDGATAARFLNEVIDLLEVPGRLLLAP